MPEALSGLQEMLDQVPAQVEAMGPYGPLYFFCIYVFAEVFALPATPLTLSAGYLFGLPMGCALALAAGTTAAGIAFTLSRTFLKEWVGKKAEENELFQNINKAVEREGFKIIFLLRLSPLLPFALSNYIYGLSNVSFIDFMAATALGFAPGTCGLVYFASTARTMFTEGIGDNGYQVAAGVLITVAVLKIVADTASRVVEEAVAADKAASASR